MSTDEVTVSLSRLALAKAIKTPDAGEDDAEPWSKSIIFHQPHIDPQMRYSIEHPQQQNRRRGNQKPPHVRHSQQYPPQQQQQRHQQQPQEQQHDTRRLVTPPMHRAQSDEMHKQSHLKQQSPKVTTTERQSYHQPTVAPERLSSHSASSSSAGRSSLSSTKLTNSKPTRRFVPSDDEEEDEDEDEDEESEDEEEEKQEEKKINKTKQDDKIKSNQEIMLPPTESKTKTKGKAPNRLPEPSDDEEEDDDNSSDSSDDDQDALSSPNDEQMYARRMSTLRQLERGPSAHRRARSLGDMNHMIVPPPVETETLNKPPPEEMGVIEEWRQTVMEAESKTSPTTPIIINESSSLPDESGDHHQIIEEPIVSTPTPTNIQGMKAQNRRSMLTDIDMYYYQQQQQQQMALQNMQMQQAMQLQQAQQMAQIQQYQQMVQMQQMQQVQQPLMPNYDTRKNRKSMSAMDLMLQLEEEKASLRKTNKKKALDPSKAKLDDGLLSKVPQQGIHNISFQGQSKATKKAMQRASKSDYNIQDRRSPNSGMYYDGGNRSNTNLGMDPRMRSQMIRSESSPIPSLNMSTPMQPMMGQYLAPQGGMMMGMQSQQQQQQQMLGMPPQMMTPSRSTGRMSYQSTNNNRLSGNWGHK